jgi:hypothetical protein
MSDNMRTPPHKWVEITGVIPAEPVEIPADSISVNRWDANGFPVYDGRTPELRLAAIEKQVEELTAQVRRLTSPETPPMAEYVSFLEYSPESALVVLSYLADVEYSDVYAVNQNVFAGMAENKLPILFAELTVEGYTDFLHHMLAYKITEKGREFVKTRKQ